MSQEPQTEQRRRRRWAVGVATLALAATGFSALPSTASASGSYRPTAPCYLPEAEAQQAPPTYLSMQPPECGTWRLVPEWNPYGWMDSGPDGPKMLAQLLWEHSGTLGVNKYNIYRDGTYYDTVVSYGRFGSYYDDDPKKDNHVYRIVAVIDSDHGRDAYSSKSDPLVKRS